MDIKCIREKALHKYERHKNNKTQSIQHGYDMRISLIEQEVKRKYFSNKPKPFDSSRITPFQHS